MKTLLFVLLFVSGSAYAGSNDAATSFATGFANGLNMALGGRPYVPPAQVQQVEVYTPPTPTPIYSPHVDVVNGSNARAGLYFFNTNECLRFLKRDGYASGYTQCVDVY